MMTDVERRAQDLILAATTTTTGRSDLAAQREAHAKNVFYRICKYDWHDKKY
jgi:hypothetical protein